MLSCNTRSEHRENRKHIDFSDTSHGFTTIFESQMQTVVELSQAQLGYALRVDKKIVESAVLSENLTFGQLSESDFTRIAERIIATAQL